MQNDATSSKMGLKSHQPSSRTERNFLIFWLGQIFSILGSWIVSFTITWWVVSTYQDAGVISFYSTLTYLPYVVLSLFAGVWVDRWNKKRIILIADTLIAFSTLGYLFLFFLEYTNIWVFIALGSLNTACAAFQQPAISAMVPMMVKRENLTRVNGLRTFSGGGVRLIGPVITGILIKFFPLNQLLWIDIITYLIATIALLTIKLPRQQKEQSEIKSHLNIKMELKKYGREFKDGFNMIKNTPIVKFLVILTLVANFLHTPWSTLYTLFIQIDHGATEQNYAFLSLMSQIGMILGSFIATLKIKWKSEHKWVVVGNILIGMFTILSVIAPRGSFWIIGFSNLGVGLVMGLLLALYYSVLQGGIAPEFQGRIYSFDAALSVSIMPIAMALSGPISEIIGISTLICICEGITILFSIYMIIRAKKKENEYLI